MIKSIFSLLFISLFIYAYAGNPGHVVTVKVNTAASSVEWIARKVTGQHNGTVAIREGELKMNHGVLEGGSFTMDMTTITVTDLSGGGKAKLESHLKSNDFFSVDSFNTAQLVITKVLDKGEGNYHITADLTIKGITNPIEFDANLKEEGDIIKATANIRVDRTLYNVRYGSGKFFENLGNAMIYDEFDLAVTLVTAK
jgi:polyisoprenoid-binding protein YceI